MFYPARYRRCAFRPRRNAFVYIESETENRRASVSLSPHQTTATTAPATAVVEVELEGRGVVKLECDWGVGIGGGVWSTGRLLAEHLCKHAALYDGVFRGKRLLELGSGTGLVGEDIKTFFLWRSSKVPHPSLRPANAVLSIPRSRCNSAPIFYTLTISE